MVARGWGMLTVYRQAEVSWRPTAGNHKDPHHLLTTTLTPTESWAGVQVVAYYRRFIAGSLRYHKFITKIW
jgi:hypothetical protein